MTFPYHLIDLTHNLEESVPTWSSECGFNHYVHLDYEDCSGVDKFRIMKLTMNAGIGTHMDAPSHLIPGGRCVHEFSVNELCMPCFVIDVSAHADAFYRLSLKDIKDFERQHGPLTSGSCVMVQTGWSKFWCEPLKYHNNHAFPSISLEAAEYLFAKGVCALGIDTLSPDRPDDGFKVHQLFLGNSKFLIENVAHLDQMPPVGAYVMVLPIKIKDGTEAPVRVVGLIKN